MAHLMVSQQDFVRNCQGSKDFSQTSPIFAAIFSDIPTRASTMATPWGQLALPTSSAQTASKEWSELKTPGSSQTQ